MSLKQQIKSVLPSSLVRAYQRWQRRSESRCNSRRSAADVFSEIYVQGKWGRNGSFYSGSGTGTASVAGPYVAAVRAFLQAFPGGKPRVVDLGCGDFSVGRQLVDACSTYVGVDVAPNLIAELQAAPPANCRFVCLDAATAELPPGEVCLIRQVLQHLSNRQISGILAKLDGYQAVLITEHYPSDAARRAANVDKVHGSGIRLYDGSGVYLDQPPFSVPADRLELLLEVPGHGFDGLYDPGVIRTYLLKPRA